MNKLVVKALMLLSAFLFVACGPDLKEEVHVESVALDQTSIELEEGQTGRLRATVTPSNADEVGVEWSSSDESVASVNDGLVRALNEGEATITVRTKDGGKTATCKVIVKAKVYQVDRIELNQTTAKMVVGDELTLIAVVYPAEAINQEVEWESSIKSVATVKDGKVTALREGETVITAKTENGKTASCTVTVKEKIYPVEGVSLDRTVAEVTEGEYFRLTATVNPANATNKNVTWTSDNEDVATVDNGKVTAVKAGAATITVTTEDGGKTATCDVTVNEKIYPVEGVSLDRTVAEITVGEDFYLTATVNPSNATNKNMTWTSDNEAVATVDNGKVTAVKAGTATITVKTEDGGKTASCKVTVKDKVYPVESVSLDRNTLDLTEGEYIDLRVTVNPANATNKNVTWKSDNEDVATVDNGKVTAVNAGTATITVKTEDGGKTASCKVTVKAKVYPVESVSLDKTVAELTEGEYFRLTATVNPANATNKNVTWKSDNEDVATVVDGKVTAVNAGTATITVKTEDGGKTASCKVTVKAKVYPVESVSLDKTVAELTEGEYFRLTATVNPANATNKNVTWDSDDEAVATVDNGKVTAVKAGTATITVKTEDGGKTASCKVTVKAKVYPVESVSLDKTVAELTEGEYFRLTATVNPSNATDKSVIWVSNNESVATVVDGKVTAIKAGTAVITVKTVDGGKTASCKVTVKAKVYPVERVTLDKTELTLVEGDEATLIATVYPYNATNKKVTWSSSDEFVVVVSQNGRVEALKAGSAEITVTTEEGGKTAVCEIIVTKEYGNEDSEKLEDEDGEW